MSKQKGGSTVYAPGMRGYWGYPEHGMIQRGEGLKKRQRGLKKRQRGNGLKKRQRGGVLKKRQRGEKKRQKGGFGGLLAIGSLLAGLM